LTVVNGKERVTEAKKQKKGGRLGENQGILGKTRAWWEKPGHLMNTWNKFHVNKY